jgi:hypothetical protein
MNTRELVEYYRRAKAQVFAAGYEDEYEWQRNRDLTRLTERDFLQEFSWVVLNSGFRESTVRRIFPFISMAFFDFVSAKNIIEHASECVRIASLSFGNCRKLNAIVSGAVFVNDIGVNGLCSLILSDSNALMRLPFIGPTTVHHLLKNLGVPAAKNDRHLARLSEQLGFANASSLCERVSANTGEPVSVIDLVLWRFCALQLPAN